MNKALKGIFNFSAKIIASALFLAFGTDNGQLPLKEKIKQIKQIWINKND